MTQTHTPLICPPATPAFRWRVTPGGVAEVAPPFESDNWISCGHVNDVDGVFSRVYDKAFENTELSWKTLRYGKRPPPEEPIAQSAWDRELERCRVEDERRELFLLALVGEACALKLDAQRWRMLSPNAVLHETFGPGVTTATDGCRVLLLSFPRFGADYMVVNRGNVIGPVTSTPVHIADWNYGENRSNISFAKVAKAEAKRKLLECDAFALLRSLNLMSTPTTN